MNEKLYDALEVCLKALETGVDIESVLKLYPQMADELRPLLEASIQAKSLAATSVPDVAVRGGRARVLQHAAGMRKAAPKKRRRWSMFAFPRLATSLAIALLFLLSGTGLVSASSGALPGDNLYSVKRSWEDLRLFFIFSPEERVGLESEFEQERLDEISELLSRGRNETIALRGLVTEQNNNTWKVSGITVMITSSSHLPADPVSVGAPVTVIGHTNAQGFVEVDTLDVLGPGTSLPPLEPSHLENSNSEDSQDHGEEPEFNGDQESDQVEHMTYEFQGVVESMEGNIWTINGQRVNVEFAESTGTVSVGTLVDFKGYYSNAGEFIVTKIEAKPIKSLKGDKSIESIRDNSGSNNNNDKPNSGGGNDSGSSESNDGGGEHNNDNGDD
jgi:hypothetical protein